MRGIEQVMDEEKRAFKRGKVKIRIAFRDSTNANKIYTVSDIGRGGIFIDTYEPDNVDGYLLASLDADEFGKVIRIQGRVVRRTQKGVAVAFTFVNKSELEVLLNYLGLS